jgi:hypothetical protein
VPHTHIATATPYLTGNIIKLFAITWLAEELLEDSTRKKKRVIVDDEQCSHLKVSW